MARRCSSARGRAASWTMMPVATATTLQLLLFTASLTLSQLTLTAASPQPITPGQLSPIQLVAEKQQQQPPQPSKCLCQATSCLCCVELNLTSSIDLGGPACVNVRHLERNVSLNLSYGDNPVHNATIALDKASRKPTCMNLLSDLAQICAEFVSMKKTSAQEEAYDGCLVIEPALLGASQATYPVGCFKFEKGLVRQIEGQVIPQQEQKPEEAEEEEEEEAGLNAEELIAAVSASAEQGIALFSQWLGLNLSPKVNVTSTKEPEHAHQQQQQQQASSSAAAAAQTAARHGRTIAMLTDPEDGEQERLKQLLSAQDNIHRESARIGGVKRGLKTAFLYSQPSADEVHQIRPESPAAPVISPENLHVVHSESRRGGRAYNIHQHVNEV